jgi:cytochrome P450
MTSFDDVDYFTDQSIVEDPYPYFDYLRSQCPVRHDTHHDRVVAVTGYEEAVAVYRDHEVFSSANSAAGPFPGLPFEPEGDDIGELIERHRDDFVMGEHMVTWDPPKHTAHRELLRKLLTPRRLKENEDFMWRLSDRFIDEFHPRGRVELMSEYAKPFSTLVIADLLGVPEDAHQAFQQTLAGQQPGDVGGDAMTGNPLGFLDERFTDYIEDRRREPRDDVLTQLAVATFPDGSLPDVIDVVRIATFLFAAGQDTTTRLLTFALKALAERPDLQQQLRDDRASIPNFIEEMLRLESPVKSDHRLARKSTTLGGVDIPAGTTITLMLGAANHDPKRFERPDEIRIDRPNVREHIAFARGVHSCPGGPLARTEGRVSIERLLDRMGDIQISESEHGPAGSRRYPYDPTYILRGISRLHLEYTPIG